MNPIWILIVIGMQCTGDRFVRCSPDPRFLGEYTSERACESAGKQVKAISGAGTDKSRPLGAVLCVPKWEKP